MDDGWFGERNDDAHSLGDWEVNEKKLPGGLAGLGRKIKALWIGFWYLGGAGDGECEQSSLPGASGLDD